LKVLKTILALAIASQLLLACSSSNSNNGNSNNANNSNNTNTTKTTSTNTNTSTTTKTANTETATSGADTGEVFTHAEGGISFERPAGWKSEQEGDRMTISTPDNALSVVIYVPAEDNFKDATAALDTEMSKTFKNMKINGEAKETTVGGMRTVSLNGTGEVSGAEIQWAVDLIQAKKPVIALTFAAPGIWEKYQADYQKFAKSIKKI
jgi:predicted Zn-dependent protease